MTVGFYNPYHTTLGGGEFYLFQMMKQFLPDNKIIYYSSNPAILEQSTKRFGIDLHAIQIEKPVFDKRSFFVNARETHRFDKLFWYSDGSIPLSFAKKTYVIFQFPIPWVHQTLVSKIKLTRISDIIVNSKFTQKSIQEIQGLHSTVIYPSVDIKGLHPSKKDKLILSVGRFTQGMNAKRQDILIQAFQKLIDQGLKEWKLVIVGGVSENDRFFFEELQKKTHGYPITLLDNIDRKMLVDLYSSATFYWHAAGYNVNVFAHPEKVEHFGISLVEAMASGCVPFVYNAGGPAEIVSKTTGFLWNSIEELVEQTRHTIEQNEIVSISNNAIKRAHDFSEDVFKKSFSKYLTQ